ncbi:MULTISPECIES: class II histone deacetylase [unclassified Micromonospora]|uniref:class II histone deacetylase n=1 Tax=unclassified Micromonospora TaxID=2617518 RepID=UPI001C236A20|nr:MULTISPECIES: class II histone deacetylase [unclassified Micromonospora]MBU8857682.1 class II histone deacetylase [Micromonospora sp. WMMB482]MDM4783309.1 class II histone deacetylase [Micromonospora sp. b486]
MATGFMTHTLFFWHDTGTAAGMVVADPVAGVQPDGHVESGATKRRCFELLDVTGLLGRMTWVEARSATVSELLRVHTDEHVRRVRDASAQVRGGDAGDGFSPVGRGSYDIARLAAGGVLELVTAVASGVVSNGYALVRPPGHHATAGTGMGFCTFNNVALAARHAQAELGLNRIAIVDIDAHHGNGTQSIFYDDPNVLAVSLHEANCFPPDSGWVEENGAGPGEGYTLNIPLPKGSGHAAYLYAMNTVVLPALDRFQPELILVATGFDGAYWDPLSCQALIADSYRQMARLLTGAAERLCGGRLVAVHEGGYSRWYTPWCLVGFVEGLTGANGDLTDPYAGIAAGYGAEPMLPHEQAVIDQTARLMPRITATVPAS